MDSAWFRAKVEDSFPDSDECLVRLVDYGGFYRVSCDDLRQIRYNLVLLFVSRLKDDSFVGVLFTLSSVSGSTS